MGGGGWGTDMGRGVMWFGGGEHIFVPRVRIWSHECPRALCFSSVAGGGVHLRPLRWCLVPWLPLCALCWVCVGTGRLGGW